MKKLAIFGAGGHAKVVIETAESNHIKEIYLCEDNRINDNLLGYKVLDVICAEDPCIIAIGNNKFRKELSKRLSKNLFVVLFHKSSTISKRALIGKGTVIMAGVTINADVKVGQHCIVNTNSSIDHDCVLEDFVHISPNVGLAGSVYIGEGTHIGVGANVIPKIKIGKWCTIGAGAVIIRDIPDNSIVIGNPGRILKK